MVTIVWPGPRSRALLTAATTLRFLDTRNDIDAARPAKAQPFVLQQVEDQRQRLLIGHLERVVDRSAFQVLRDSPLTDTFRDGTAFGLQLALGVIIVKRRAHRIGQRDPDVLV